MRTSKLRRQRLRELAQAGSYAEWKQVADALDELDGGRDWKLDDSCEDYDDVLIRQRLHELRSLRESGEVRRLVFALHEGLHGNIGNISNPALYSVARVGTKQLIEHYVGEVCRCLDYICAGDFPDFSDNEKVLFFKRTGTVFGRTALMLSGGATLGMFHLGVIKALLEQGLLPRVISGSSAGSIIAGLVGVRTDEELRAVFEPGGLNLEAFERVSLKQALRKGALMDPEALKSCLELNVGELSFEQAFERSRRIIGVTVSPAEPHQQGRLLNYLTAPNVMMHSAILASCAVPGVFPPVMLEARDFEGRIVPYMPSMRWMDGTMSADLPALRLARLHNVNHYIVSQTNPHIVPFMTDKLPKSGVAPFARELISSSSRNALELAQRHFDRSGSGRVVNKLHNVVRQRYSGDINIFPSQSPRQLMRMFSNPSADDIHAYIRAGERATWPKLERIRIQTRISRAFENSLIWLKAQRRDQHQPGSAADRRRKMRAVS